MAIGKPGGIDAEKDKYDTIVSLKCLKCNIIMNHTDERIAPFINSILIAESSYFQSAVQEWEVEL